MVFASRRSIDFIHPAVSMDTILSGIYVMGIIPAVFAGLAVAIGMPKLEYFRFWHSLAIGCVVGLLSFAVIGRGDHSDRQFEFYYNMAIAIYTCVFATSFCWFLSSQWWPRKRSPKKRRASAPPLSTGNDQSRPRTTHYNRFKARSPLRYAGYAYRNRRAIFFLLAIAIVFCIILSQVQASSNRRPLDKIDAGSQFDKDSNRYFRPACRKRP